MSSPDVEETIKTPYGKLVEELENSEGAQISRKLRQLGISYNVFFSNYSDLKRALELFRRPDIAFLIWLPHNRETIDVYQRDVIRLLHNFVAGAKTLVEHSRNTIRELCEKTDFWEEYQDRVMNTFANEPVIKFVEELRNYALHKNLPYTTATFHMTNPPENSMMLNLDTLRNSYKWKDLSKKYLDKLGDRVNLESVISEYATIVIDFHKWLEERLQEVHKKAFEKTEEIRERIREFVGPLPPDEVELTQEQPQSSTEETPATTETSILSKVKLYQDPTGGVVNNRIITTIIRFVEQYTDLNPEEKANFLNAILFVGWNLIETYSHVQVYQAVERERRQNLKDSIPIEIDPTATIEPDYDLYSELDGFLSSLESTIDATFNVPVAILGSKIWRVRSFDGKGDNILSSLQRVPKKDKPRAEGIKNLIVEAHLPWLKSLTGKRKIMNQLFCYNKASFAVYKSAKEGRDIIYVPKWVDQDSPVSTVMGLTWTGLIKFVEEVIVTFLGFRLKGRYILQNIPPSSDPTQPGWEILTPDEFESRQRKHKPEAKQ